MATTRLPSPLSAPGVRERDRQTGRGLAPAPAPPGAPQGAAGDSSPSEPSCVAFLVRGGPRGVNQLLGAVRSGQPWSSAQAWEAVVRGQDGTWWGGEWRGVNTLPCQPLHTTHLIFSEPPPEAQGCRGVLPPLSIRRGWTGLSPAQWSPLNPHLLNGNKTPLFHREGVRTQADVERARRAPRTARSPEPSPQTPGVGPLTPILQMKRLRPGGDGFPRAAQLTTGRAKPPTRP